MSRDPLRPRTPSRGSGGVKSVSRKKKQKLLVMVSHVNYHASHRAVHANRPSSFSSAHARHILASKESSVGLRYLIGRITRVRLI